MAFTDCASGGTMVGMLCPTVPYTAAPTHPSPRPNTPTGLYGMPRLRIGALCDGICGLCQWWW